MMIIATNVTAKAMEKMSDSAIPRVPRVHATGDRDHGGRSARKIWSLTHRDVDAGRTRPRCPGRATATSARPLAGGRKQVSWLR